MIGFEQHMVSMQKVLPLVSMHCQHLCWRIGHPLVLSFPRVHMPKLWCLVMLHQVGKDWWPQIALCYCACQWNRTIFLQILRGCLWETNCQPMAIHIHLSPRCPQMSSLSLTIIIVSIIARMSILQKSTSIESIHLCDKITYLVVS